MNPALHILQERGFIQQCTDIEGLSRLMDQGPVTVYVGADPTAPSLHIGHMVPFFALRHLRAAGHTTIALLGGGTARIGDPSGKTELRKMLSGEQIDANAVAMASQLDRFLTFDGTHALAVNNKDWLGSLNYIDFLREIGVHFSVNRMLTFEAYRKRMETGLTFIEFNYQLLQSYDFLQLHDQKGCRLQIGGDDQWGNIVAGIDLIRRMRGTEVFGLTFPLLTTADGKKMGKSEKGALFLDPALVSPYEFFQYWRNTQDADVARFLPMFTFLDMDECRRLGALKDARINEAKERLAWEVTALIHGREAADKALSAAQAAFGGAAAGLENMPGLDLAGQLAGEGAGILDILVQCQAVPSKGEARRLVQQGGCFLGETRVQDVEFRLSAANWDGFALDDGSVILKAGKKRLYRLGR